MNFNSGHISLAISLLAGLLAVILSAGHIFFWDTIQLASKHAHYYFEPGAKGILLPERIDSGHPPAFGMYIAGCWLLFGRSLLVSHFAMLPFVFLLVYQWYRLGSLIGERQFLSFFMALLLFDPVVGGQAVLVSPDIVLAGCFLLVINAILRKENAWKLLGIAGLGMISLRGMMLGLLLFLWDALFANTKPGPARPWRRLWTRLPPYLPGGLLALLFLIYHYLSTGWVGYHADSEWAPGFARADLRQMLRNGAVLLWRLLDFGRIFLWLGLLYVGWLALRNKDLKKALHKPGEGRKWLALLLLLTSGLGINFILFAGLHQHRYLLPAFLALTIYLYDLITRLKGELIGVQSKKLLLILLIAGLGSGNLWIYPPKISQGWDSTLAHWPYYQLRTKMISYVSASGIPPGEIGTAFPDIGAFKYKDLSQDTTGFKEKDLLTDNYILYSNIMNDFTDEELDALKEDWEVLKETRAAGVCMILYKRKK